MNFCVIGEHLRGIKVPAATPVLLVTVFVESKNSWFSRQLTARRKIFYCKTKLEGNLALKNNTKKGKQTDDINKIKLKF